MGLNPEGRASLLHPWTKSTEAGQPNPALSAVIPVLNGGARLLQLLDSLFAQDCPGGLEVLIADSGSTDGAVEEARKRRPELRGFSVLEGTFNHGRVRSAMVAAARAPLVALFSQDAVPMSSRYLALLSAPFAQQNVVGTYARQVPRPGADPLVHATLNQWTPPPSPGSKDSVLIQALPPGRCLTDLAPNERMRLSRFDNVGSMVRRKVVLEHPFPARAFGEDLAWGASMVERGFSLAYVPGARVEHHHEPSLTESFRRNLVAHRQAAGEFGLHSVPDLGNAFAALLMGIPSDLEAGPMWAIRGLPRRAAALLGQWVGGRQGTREHTG